MYRATTPTIRFKVPIDLTHASHVYVTFSRGKNTELTKEDAELNITENSVEVFLTQEETLSLPLGKVDAQINWTYTDEGVSKRACSNVVQLMLDRNLIEEVLE